MFRKLYPLCASPHLSPTGLESIKRPLRKFTGGRPKFLQLDRWTTIGAVEWTDKTGKKHPPSLLYLSGLPPMGSIIVGLKDELRQTLRRGVLGFCAGAVDKGEDQLDSLAEVAILDEQNVVIRELKEELGVVAKPEQMLTPTPRSALLDSVSDCLKMSIPFYMSNEADMANIGEQELEPGEDIKPCFFHLEDLPALLTLLKETGHPCTQELSSFILGYMFARMEGDIKRIKQEKKELSMKEVQGLWDRLRGGRAKLLQ